MEYISQLYITAALSARKYPPALNKQGNVWTLMRSGGSEGSQVSWHYIFPLELNKGKLLIWQIAYVESE
jgi:hypothetical protein